MSNLSNLARRRKLDAEFARMNFEEKDAFLAKAQAALNFLVEAMREQSPDGRIDGINGARMLGVPINSPSSN